MRTEFWPAADDDFGMIEVIDDDGSMIVTYAMHWDTGEARVVYPGCGAGITADDWVRAF